MIGQVFIMRWIPNGVVDAIQDACAFAFFIFKQGLQTIAHVSQFMEIGIADGGYFPGGFDTRSKGIDATLPLKQPSFPAVPLRNIQGFVPAKRSLVLCIVDG